MRIIVGSNIILSALLKRGLSRKIISSQNIEFYTLDYVLGEPRKYFDYIAEKSGVSKTGIETLLSFFMENITIIPDEKIKSKMNEAKEIMKNIDIKDAPIVACALAIPNDSIWTTDKHFEKQKRIKVWHSIDLLEYI